MKANTYPIFEADQVLTSGHLNDLVVYLEEQERLSRNKLIGIGIVCGLQLNYSATGSKKQISISKGCGITSEGYLVAMEKTVCTHVREDNYTDPVDYPDLQGMKLMELLTQEDASLEEKKDVSPISTISQNTLQKMAVLLYLEKLDEDLKNCIPEDCNDKGKKRIFTIRKLLVNQADLRLLISRKSGFKVPQTEATLESAVNGAFYLSDVFVPRVVIPSVNSIELSTLQGLYSSSINQAIPQLAESIAHSSQLLQPAIADLQDQDLTASKVETILKNSFEQLKKDQPTALQYFYAFLNDLAEAYHDFRDEAADVLSLCSPDESLFGCHLMLGEVTNSKACEPSIYRHRWHPSPIHNTPNHLEKKLRSLYTRLLEMLNNFEIPVADEIRVTPSNDSTHALASRAIPYYYRVTAANGLYKSWDYNKQRKCLSDSNLSYHSSRYANPANKARYRSTTAPLNFSLAKKDFFRIEGHLGKNYQNSIQSIQQQRDLYGLAFDVVALKLGRVPDDPILDQQCFFRDLDTQYATLRQEWLCFLTKESNYFANIEYQPQAASTSDEKDEGAAEKFYDGKTVFDYSHYSNKRYRNYSGGESVNTGGNVMKDSATGYSKAGTIGNMVTGSFSSAEYTFDIQNILTTFISRYSDLAKLPVGTLLLRVQYPLQMISLLEDAVVAIPDELNELDFEEFESAYDKLIEKAQEFKDKIHENLAKDDFQELGNEEDISDHLDRFIFDCNLSRFKVLHDEYQKRVKQIARESLLSEYAKKHPGLEHTGGVPKGGTFVLIYHDQNYSNPNTERPNSGRDDILSWVVENAPRDKSEYSRDYRSSRKKSINPTSGKKKSASIKSENAVDPSNTAYLFNSALEGPLSSAEDLITKESLWANRLNINLNQLVNKTVVGDLSLPYMCRSECPAVTYVFPSVEASLSLPERIFCRDDQSHYPFSAAPGGGELKGPGVTQNEDGQFVFSPSASDVQVGMLSFSYEVDGKTATFEVEILANPVAKFTLSMDNLQRTDNGVFLSIKNESEHADQFLWEVNGENSKDKDLRNFFVANVGETLNVKLTATNAACFDTTSQSLKVASEPLIFETATGETSFCADSKESIDLITKPNGGKVVADSSAFNVIQNGDQFSFIPGANPSGVHQLTYSDPEGRSTNLTLIIAQPNASYSVKPTDADGSLISLQLTPVDRTADLYTWRIGTKEVHKTSQLPSPGPEVDLDFSDQNPIDLTLEVVAGKCSSNFTLSLDAKTLLSQLRNNNDGRDTDNGGDDRDGGATPGNSISVGRGSNSVVITHLGRNSSLASKALTTDLGVDSVTARKALARLPLTIKGISNAKLKDLQSRIDRSSIKYQTVEG